MLAINKNEKSQREDDDDDDDDDDPWRRIGDGSDMFLLFVPANRERGRERELQNQLFQVSWLSFFGRGERESE
jgi:hypothetical protein